MARQRIEDLEFVGHDPGLDDVWPPPTRRPEAARLAGLTPEQVARDELATAILDLDIQRRGRTGEYVHLNRDTAAVILAALLEWLDLETPPTDA